eukprot:2700683-Rhodomonas_salina.2
MRSTIRVEGYTAQNANCAAQMRVDVYWDAPIRVDQYCADQGRLVLLTLSCSSSPKRSPSSPAYGPRTLSQYRTSRRKGVG